MGVDYRGEGGIGFRITPFMEDAIRISLGYNEDWEDEEGNGYSITEVLEDFCGDGKVLSLAHFGNLMCDVGKFAIVIPETSLKTCLEKAPEFVAKLNEKGLNVLIDDLEVIVEMQIS